MTSSRIAPGSRVGEVVHPSAAEAARPEPLRSEHDLVHSAIDRAAPPVAGPRLAAPDLVSFTLRQFEPNDRGWPQPSLSTDTWRKPEHTLGDMTRQIVQNAIDHRPLEAAGDIAHRVASFQRDTKSWWEPSNRSRAQGVLSELHKDLLELARELHPQAALSPDTPLSAHFDALADHDDEVSEAQKKAIWQAFDRLQALERFNGKVPLSDAYLASFVNDRAWALKLSEGYRIPPQNLRRRDETAVDTSARERVSKGMAQLRDELVERRLLGLGLENDPAFFSNLAQKDPFAAYLLVRRHADTLLNELRSIPSDHAFEYDHEEEAVEKLLLKRYESDGMGEWMQKARAELASIEASAGLGSFDETLTRRLQLRSAASQAIDFPRLVEKDPKTALALLKRRAEIVKAELGYFAKAELTAPVQDILAMTLAVEGQSPDEAKARLLSAYERFSAVEQKLNLIPTNEAMRQAAAGGDLAALRVEAQAEAQSWPDWARGWVSHSIPAYFDRNFISGKLDEGARQLQATLRDPNQALDVKISNARKALPQGNGVSDRLIRWYANSVLDGVSEAAQRGQFDPLLSKQGLNNLLASTSTFLKEAKTEALLATDAEIPDLKKQLKQNAKETARDITDLLLPPNKGVLQGFQRFVTRMALEYYVLNGFAARMTNNKAGFAAMDGALKWVKMAIGNEDLSKRTEAQRLKTDLAMSRYLRSIARELTQSKIPSAPEGVDAAAQVPMHLQAIIDQLDPSTLLSLSWGPGLVASGLKSVVRWSLEDLKRQRDNAQQDLLQRLDAMKKNGKPEYKIGELEAMVKASNYQRVSTALQSLIERPGIDGTDRLVFELLKRDVTAMLSYRSALSASFDKAHREIIQNGVSPWLRGSLPA